MYFTERADPPRNNQYSRRLSPIHYDSSKHPIRIHASVVDHLTTEPKDYTLRAIWHGLPEGSFPYVEDAVPADKLPIHEPPKGEDAGKAIGHWSERAKAAINRDQKGAQREGQKEAPGVLDRIGSFVQR